MKLHFLTGIICLFQLPHTLHAQKGVMNGTVFSDKTRQGIPGVSISAGKTITRTDREGKYSIAASERDTLIFSKYGFRAKRLIAGSEDTLNVRLSAHEVIIPYGTADEEGFTGSVVLVQPALWNNRSFTNLLLALQGAGTGIQTTSPSGDPGAGPGVRIRGTSSLESSGPPLYIVDGVEFTGSFSDLNPHDIESITVLKDAVNRTMYGRKGLNGVVMINTRTGAGRSHAFDFSMQMGTATNGVPAYNTVSPAEYYELHWQAYRNNLVYSSPGPLPVEIAGQIASGLLPRGLNGLQIYNDRYYQDIVQLLGGYNAFNVPDNELIGPDGKLNPQAVLQHPGELNWMDAISRTGKRNEYNMAYSTGIKRLDVLTSLNYLREEGWSNWSALERYTGRLNLNYQATRWFKSGLRVAATRSGNDHVSSDSDYLNPFYFAREIGAIYPVHFIDPKTGEVVYDSEGKKVYDVRGLPDSDYPYNRPFVSNYHAVFDNDRISDHTIRKLYSGRVFMNFILLPWLTLDLTGGGEKSESKRERKTNGSQGNWRESWYKNNHSSYTINQVLTIYKPIGNGELNFVVGHENFMLSTKDSSETYTRNSLDSLGLNPLMYSKYKENQESYFMKARAGLFHRYFLDWAYRKDQHQHYGNLQSWSVGGSLRLGQVDFSQAAWKAHVYATYGKSVGIHPPSLFRLPNIIQHPFAAGVNFSLMKNRLRGSLEYYSTKVEDLVNTMVYWPGNVEDSGGKQVNSGIEASLTSVLVKSKRFSCAITWNLTSQKDVITEMPANMPVIQNGRFRLQKGVSKYSYYIRSFYGVDPKTGEVLYQGVNNYDPADPAIKIIETGSRKDTVTTNHNIARQMFIGKSALPKGYGSIVNSLGYGNFDLKLLITYQFGGWVMDDQYMSPGTVSGRNYHKDLLKAWQKPGDITNVPRMDIARSAQFGSPSTRWLFRSDYVSLTGVKLSYHIPEKTLSFMKATVFLNAENVYFLTHRKGMNTLSFAEYSADSYAYNFARKFNLGLNIKV